MNDWPGWRGKSRDGVLNWLPERLPEAAEFVWKNILPSQGIGGLAASAGVVVVSGRSSTDTADLFQCFDAETGEQVWQLKYYARGRLDYGNTPRATPLIHQGHVWLLGAFGDLHCLRLSDGNVIWKKNLKLEFDAPDMIWGHAGTPLLVDNKLIVQPGGPEAALVAIEPLTGKVLWERAGSPPGYSSLIAAEINGKTQVIGYDETSLCGWEPETGKKIWTLKPEYSGDFNVPTPIMFGNRLFTATENNGARVYQFAPNGRIVPEPVMFFEYLTPDSHTPVIARNRLFGVWEDLFCLDLKNNLELVWLGEDRAFMSYVSLVTDSKQVMALTTRGELILFPSSTNSFKNHQRLKLTERRTETFSHPAFLGSRMYLRLGKELCCLELDDQN